MQFKHTLSIFSANLSLSYKVLILIFVVAIISAALFVSIFNPLLQGIYHALELEGLTLSIREIVENPVDRLSEIWKISSNFLSQNTGMVVSRFLYLSLLMVTVRFFISIALVPISKIIHSKMISGYSNGLFNNLVATLLPSLGFAFFSSIIYALLDIGIFFLSLYTFLGLYRLIGIGALLFGLAFFVVLISIRMALFSQWISVICDGQNNIFKALAEGVKLSISCFKVYFPIILTLVTLFATILTTTTFTTFGVFPIVAFPMFMILICIANLTCYFNLKMKKYYIDDGVTVYNPKRKLKDKN